MYVNFSAKCCVLILEESLKSVDRQIMNTSISWYNKIIDKHGLVIIQYVW